ncbi:MAG: AMP-binding protein [Clostridia bacterium]|nr:AMP-binding protein [Clostridia bacterium]
MENRKRKLYEGENLTDFRELINRYENRYGSKTAFIYKASPKSAAHITISYSQFAEDIKSLATSFLHLGLQGKKIALIAPNGYEWCTSYLAITTADISIIPLDKSLPENEIKNLLIRSKADGVIFDKQYLSIFEEILKENNTCLQQYICIDKVKHEGFLQYSSLCENGKKLLKSGDTKYQSITINPNNVSILLFTSGTTAISKCVGLSQFNICSDIYALSQMTNIKKEDVFLSFLPLHHTFESTCTFLYGTSCGISIAFCDGLKYVQKNLVEFQITGLVCVPLMLEIMYKKIQKGVEEHGKTGLVKFMRKVCNFLLKFGIDIRRKVFHDILAKFGGKLRILIAGRSSYE